MTAVAAVAAVARKKLSARPTMNAPIHPSRFARTENALRMKQRQLTNVKKTKTAQIVQNPSVIQHLRNVLKTLRRGAMSVQAVSNDVAIHVQI
jgi:hypothetical protein